MNLKEQMLDLPQMTETQFTERFGGLYERSPWVAESVWSNVNTNQKIDCEALATELKSTVDASTDEQKMTLLRAHPELVGKAAVQGELTPESTDEQSRARLDQCSEEEYEKFQTLNSAYNGKFGFPFIMAVRNSNREEILAAFESRLNNPVEDEFNTALKQVHQIALLRLEAAVTLASDNNN